MNKETKDCINRLVLHYSDLEEEKENCKTQEEAAISLWVASSGLAITASHKKAIKKIAKAIATNKLDELEEDIKAECKVLEDSERSYGIQLSLFTEPIESLRRTLGEGESLEISGGGRSVTLTN
jgi:hypothetical protein